MARTGVPVKAMARVSTRDQKAELQLTALHKAGCADVYSDHGVSGKLAARPELDKCLAALQPGDTLVVWKLDRLGRSLQHLVATVAELAERGVGFRSLTESIDTTTNGGRLIFQHLRRAG
jgi:DNA invertase Pin-like site-specific DNA recombinase